jgi:hypothetical protein
MKGKLISALDKYVCRIKALLVTFNDILKCKGIYKPYMEAFNNVDLESFKQLIINILTLDNMPRKNKRLYAYISDFVFQTIYYFQKKNMIKKKKNKRTR